MSILSAARRIPRCECGVPFPQAYDWWIASIDGGPAIKTGAVTTLRGKGFSLTELASGVPSGVPGAWGQRDQLIFSGVLGDSNNLWQIPISSKTWKVTGSPQRLTFGTGVEAEPAVAGSHLVFASLFSNDDIWSFAGGHESGKSHGKLTAADPGRRRRFLAIGQC